LLPDGRVLLVICCTYEQVYDPATGTFSFTGRTSSINEDGFAAASLANGMVLVQGGYFEEGNVVTAGADLYDPSSGVFTPTGKMNTPRYAHTATLLCDGTVLVAGGEGNTESEFALASAEIYDPATGTFSRTGDMSAARVTHTATPLLDGTVLIAGGLSVDQRFVTSAEVYHPGSSCIGQF
jgi:hypothetical protein